MVCEVLAVQPHAQRAPANILNLIQLFLPMFRLRSANNTPVNVQVVVSYPRWTKRRLRNPLRMTADSSVISKNGDVAVHVLQRWKPSARFQFNAQQMEVKTCSFLWLIHVRTELQVAHTLHHAKKTARQYKVSDKTATSPLRKVCIPRSIKLFFAPSKQTSLFMGL